MENESIQKQVLYLHQVQKLSGRQIAKTLGVGRKLIQRIVSGQVKLAAVAKPEIVSPYQNLITHWYKEYPGLKALQIYERLKSYGYEGSYSTVARFTQKYRCKKKEAYHVLQFLPGEEAQIDWFFFRHEKLGVVAGFLYVLCHSRYAWGGFYPRTGFEFFLQAHLDVFGHLKGLAHRHRYDNLKSVVLKHEPTVIEYNPQFLDFARFFGFSIHACNPYKGNEKGRVERLIRDARIFLYGESFSDLRELNQKFRHWLTKRNDTIHRVTDKTPRELFGEERLLGLPQGEYPARRLTPVLVSKTALVEFETNRYSVPSGLASKMAELVAEADRIEIWVSGQRVAQHARSFERKKLFLNPLHSERLLQQTRNFKFERIYQLIQSMDPAFEEFLGPQEEAEKYRAAYEIFQLLKTHSRGLLVSAIRELNRMGARKIKALGSLLNLPETKEPNPIWPQNPELLNLNYRPRRLQDYDPAH